LALEDRFGTRMKFIVVDVENEEDPSTGQLLNMFHVNYIPAFFIIDSQGKRVYEKVGIVSREELEHQITGQIP